MHNIWFVWTLQGTSAYIMTDPHNDLSADMWIIINNTQWSVSVLMKQINNFFSWERQAALLERKRLISFSWWSAVGWAGYYTKLLPLPQSCTSFIIHKRSVNLPRAERPSARPDPNRMHIRVNQLCEQAVVTARGEFTRPALEQNSQLPRDNNEDYANGNTILISESL